MGPHRRAQERERAAARAAQEARRAEAERKAAAEAQKICLVHHFNAAGTKLRGHSSIYNNIDQVVLVTKHEASKVRTAVLDKQKDGEDGVDIKFELLQIELGKRQLDGKPIISCVTTPIGERLALKVAGKGQERTLSLTDQQRIVMQCLYDALAEYGEPTPAALKLPKSIVTVVKYKHWQASYRSKVDNDAACRQAMKRAGEKFLAMRLIGRIDPYVWLTGRAAAGVSEPRVGSTAGPVTAQYEAEPEFPDDFK